MPGHTMISPGRRSEPAGRAPPARSPRRCPAIRGCRQRDAVRASGRPQARIEGAAVAQQQPWDLPAGALRGDTCPAARQSTRPNRPAPHGVGCQFRKGEVEEIVRRAKIAGRSQLLPDAEQLGADQGERTDGQQNLGLSPAPSAPGPGPRQSTSLAFSQPRRPRRAAAQLVSRRGR